MEDQDPVTPERLRPPQTSETLTKESKGKVISTTVNEIGRYDHVYVSTAAYGGTIFWKLNPEYVKINRAKEYK